MQQSQSKIDSFVLKIIAIVGMTANHAGHTFYAYLPPLAKTILIGAGGLTFPIMAYLLVIGYQHTRDVRRYAMRLAIFALVSLLPFIWVLGDKLNVLFTLLLGLGVIWADDHLKNRLVFWALLISAIIATHWCDWSYIGVPMILLYHRGRDQKWQTVLPIILVWVWGLSNLINILPNYPWSLYWTDLLPNVVYCFVAASATIPLLMNYNGERGRPLKFFFYAYYPAHIALLGLLRGILYGIWW
ncbi:MAG: conjugal transfer protein TraX [Coriobacteriales bacterium]|jgi:hypothetical protein|nr:conjugal transfer protein TraX [Coriobacteriales bacterium]